MVTSVPTAYNEALTEMNEKDNDITAKVKDRMSETVSEMSRIFSPRLPRFVGATELLDEMKKQTRNQLEMKKTLENIWVRIERHFI